MSWEDEQAAYEEHEREMGDVGLIAAILMGFVIGTAIIGWIATELAQVLGY